jgi:hypothetical protein
MTSENVNQNGVEPENNPQEIVIPEIKDSPINTLDDDIFEDEDGIVPDEEDLVVIVEEEDLEKIVAVFFSAMFALGFGAIPQGESISWLEIITHRAENVFMPIKEYFAQPICQNHMNEFNYSKDDMVQCLRLITGLEAALLKFSS